jgi:hypothetical protein
MIQTNDFSSSNSSGNCSKISRATSKCQGFDSDRKQIKEVEKEFTIFTTKIDDQNFFFVVSPCSLQYLNRRVSPQALPSFLVTLQCTPSSFNILHSSPWFVLTIRPLICDNHRSCQNKLQNLNQNFLKYWKKFKIL